MKLDRNALGKEVPFSTRPSGIEIVPYLSKGFYESIGIFVIFNLNGNINYRF